VKLSDLRKNITKLEFIGNDDQLQKLHSPQKSMYFVKDENKLEAAPRPPDSMQTRGTTDAGDALAMKDPRKAKYFGIAQSTLRLG